ncbi:hypothetical protein PBAL39_20425, partial [Pedobacter sp. BAL39]|uniref:hypothetical protein n=1 Tax=Pedobacter sp. BAL39 TaxID=391596 RepID=UPI000155A17E
TVTEVLSKHGIDQRVLNPDNLKAPAGYAFELKETTTTAGKAKEIIAKFDPTLPEAEQWTVVSVDGKSPSNGDIKTFRKNKAKPQGTEKTDMASYQVEQETPDKLILSYKPDVREVPKDALFLNDCKLHMTINLKTKKLEQVQLLNEKPVQVGPMRASKFEVIKKFTTNEQANRYLPLSDVLNMDAKFLGQEITVQTIMEYSDYVKK